ncbi:tyrosine-type recombinase/integrase [Pectobacterium versatile]|uniref:tyrosine-type recombinase/integrase n=1 Tax=Pectobacterium versatile TaxID=2488639 RepID=UPI001CF54458|nr:tyrosine-type recombinase/integrase [Pectobacterium versatile]MCA6926514.1 tyrosine-type recombinase/integrase [Pectobacterium versatile]MCH5083264.1 DUF3258 domain-containing protein [Pectobacterium versatile]
MKKLTERDIDLFVADLNIEIIELADSIPAEARMEALSSTRGPIPVEIRQECASFFAEYYESSFLSGEESATENYFKGALSSAYDITGMEKEIAAASLKYSILLNQSQRAQLAFLRKDIPQYISIVNGMKQSAASHLQSIDSVIEIDESKPNEMTLIQAWEGFLEFKSDWKPKIRKCNEKYFEVIQIVLGADTLVSKITRRDIKNMLETVEGLPRQNMKPYNRMTVQECLEMDDIPVEDFVSPKTVKDYLKLCQGLFSTFLTNDIGALESSPTGNIRYEARSQSYGKYSRTEMRKLVEHFSTLDGWKKWGFLLLAYTGARRAEIVKLKISDVRFDDDSQRYYIMIDDSKTDAGTRQVPLALRLINMGFLNYLKGKKPDEKIFSDIAYNNQVTRIFHDIRETLGIEYLDDYKRRRIVHSLRHTFITEAQIKHNLTLIQQTVGHEHSNTGQTKNYTHQFTVSDLLPVVDGIDWFIK